MSDHEKSPKRGIPAWALNLDFEIGNMGRENLLKYVGKLPWGAREAIKIIAEEVHNAPPGAQEWVTERLTYRQPVGEEMSAQFALIINSLKPDTLNKLDTAIRKVEQMEEGKKE